MTWWKKVTNFLRWSVSNDTKVVEDRGHQEGKKIFSGAYTKQEKPKYETVGGSVTQRLSKYFDWLRKKFSGDSSK